MPHNTANVEQTASQLLHGIFSFLCVAVTPDVMIEATDVM